MRRWPRYAFPFSLLVVQACACESAASLGIDNDAGFDSSPDVDAYTSDNAPRDAALEVESAVVDTQYVDPRRGAPYPIVLAHGFLGFDAFAGSDFVHYFFRVQEHLRGLGESEVFTPAVDPFQTSARRAEQLADAIAVILQQTGSAKVNIIAHSQGGLDARVVAARHPEWIASVTTIATPHHGTPVSDVALGLVAHPRLRDVVDAVVRLFARPLYDAAGHETSVFAALRQLSTAEMRAFNDEFRDAANVAYFSIAGRSAGHYGWNRCASDGRPSFITRWDAYADILDPAFAVTGPIADGNGILPEPHDGLVPVESAYWGRFLGCIPADHMDEVGQILGDSPGLLNPFNHLSFYAQLVAWLRSQGL